MIVRLSIAGMMWVTVVRVKERTTRRDAPDGCTE
jgi:hypothetical protein